MITVEIKGLDEMLKEFAKLGEVGAKYAEKAINETAIEGVSTMRKHSPVVTNRLRSSIHFEGQSTKSYVYANRNGTSYIGKFSGQPQKLEAWVGTNVEYAGAVNRFSKKGGFFEKGVKQMQYILPIRMRVNWEKAIKEVLRK